jgi:hypothetical protein
MTTQLQHRHIYAAHSSARRWWHIVLLCCLGVFALEGVASAAAPFTRRTKSFIGSLEYGAFVGAEGAPNPYSVGLNARAGLTLDSDVYVGGMFEYFFGGSAGGTDGSALQFMVEGGYDLALSPTAILRPKLGAGLSHITFSASGGDTTESLSASKLAVAPAVQAVISAGSVLLALEARFNLVLDADANGLILGAGVGTTF